MLFPRRGWAIRVIKKTSFSIRSREATTLIEMLIWASKQLPSQAPVGERVLISAMTMVHNQSAIVDLAAELDLHPVAAQKALAELQEAAISVATEHGMPDLVRLARRL
jgi:hypothetical protein